MSTLDLLQDEASRLEAFPVCRKVIFLAHAGVTALPRAVADAMVHATREASEAPPDFPGVFRHIQQTRAVAARFLGAHPEEIALLGPTSLGLSLVANGIPWQPGDEVICHGSDYPANVYPWLGLRERGVTVRTLEPERPGEITPELIEAALTPRTRLVALASCHFVSGYRIDVDAIGRLLHARGVLFCLDAIQTLGAFPLNVEHVDFLSADAHKWMLGPCAIGIVYVKRAHFGLLRPTLLGAENVKAPHYIAQNEIRFPETAARYEPGALNTVGIYGMRAALELLAECGIEAVAARILRLRAHLVEGLRPLGFELYGPAEGPNASGITSFTHPHASMAGLFRQLESAGIIASLRHNRAGQELLRLSPHFYNTEAELDRALEVLRAGVSEAV